MKKKSWECVICARAHVTSFLFVVFFFFSSHSFATQTLATISYPFNSSSCHNCAFVSIEIHIYNFSFVAHCVLCVFRNNNSIHKDRKHLTSHSASIEPQTEENYNSATTTTTNKFIINKNLYERTNERKNGWWWLYLYVYFYANCCGLNYNIIGVQYTPAQTSGRRRRNRTKIFRIKDNRERQRGAKKNHFSLAHVLPMRIPLNISRLSFGCFEANIPWLLWRCDVTKCRRQRWWNNGTAPPVQH